MRLQGPENVVRFGAAVLAAALAGLLGAGSVRSEGSPVPAPSADPVPSASPAPSPAPNPSPAPAATPGTDGAPDTGPGAPPAVAELPRIIRTVCTDRVCGGCDGKCRAGSGHVAVDKKGRCACTPTDGGALDRAIRQAYQRNPPR